MWLDIRVVDVELPDGRHLAHRLIRTPPGAGGVVIRDRQALLLWRHQCITGSQGWEIPIGKIEPGEDPATAAARETEEETGWRPGPLSFMLRAEPTPACPTRCTLASVPSLIRCGDTTSGTTLAALLYMIASGQ